MNQTVRIGVALELSGGYGRYQKKLILEMVPIILTSVLCVNMIIYITPSIICEMKITKYEQGLLFSAIFLGMIAGGFIWGTVSDTFGRRSTLIVLIGGTFTFELLLAFTSVSYWSLFFWKVCSGFTNSGVITSCYAYVNEFVSYKYKDKATMRIGTVLAFGFFIQPVIAIFILPLRFKYVLVPHVLIMNSWKLFVLVNLQIHIIGLLIALLVLEESPAFLLRVGRHEEALELVRHIYSENTGNPPDDFPVKNILLQENKDTDAIKQEDKQYPSIEIIGSPLMYQPYLFPFLTVFCSQFITMAAFSGIRSHMATLTTLSLGLGQTDNAADFGGHVPNGSFCQMFKTQLIFQSTVNCTKNSLLLNEHIYACATFIGFFMFVSFFPATLAIQKFGKIRIFLIGHTIGAICISVVPFSNGYISVFLLTIIAMCMQNCMSISVSLVVNRIPTSVRGVTVSLIMIGGRLGVIVGSMILPVMTNISCEAGFWSIAVINLLAYPIILIYVKLPNPLMEDEIKEIRTMEKPEFSQRL